MRVYKNLIINKDIIYNIQQSLANKKLIENDEDLINCYELNFKEVIKYKNIIFNISFNVLDKNNIICQVEDNFNSIYMLDIELSNEIDIYNQLIDYIINIIKDAE
ncbi:hypothetical protein ACOQ7M_001768 [Campylobacter jejuni]|nr:hypothetical protein [Campylobacter jejuni]EHC1462697.1 hypothetical protein [Campylobacter jejuni]EHN8305304.1 hypothetical protein [Campylobacter jejuni]